MMDSAYGGRLARLPCLGLPAPWQSPHLMADPAAWPLNQCWVAGKDDALLLLGCFAGSPGFDARNRNCHWHPVRGWQRPVEIQGGLCSEAAERPVHLAPSASSPGL